MKGFKGSICQYGKITKATETEKSHAKTQREDGFEQEPTEETTLRKDHKGHKDRLFEQELTEVAEISVLLS